MLSVAIDLALFTRTIYSDFGKAQLYIDSPDLSSAISSHFNLKKLLKTDVKH